MTITAGDILKLLEERHKLDVFVPECSIDSSHNRGYGRIDAWAMKKSYANSRTWGYEIKVSRRDFIQDEKWKKYMTVCDSFYFVCPWGLIDSGEVPEGVGLIYAASTGNRLITKKKAAAREVDIPENFWRSILKNRAQIICSAYYGHPQTREDRIKYWRNWIEAKKETLYLGHEVSKKIREHVEAVESENSLLQNQNEQLSAVKERLSELGFNINLHTHHWNLKIQVENIVNSVPSTLESDISRAITSLQIFKKTVEKLKSPAS